LRPPLKADIAEPFQYAYLNRYDALPKSGDEHEAAGVHQGSRRSGSRVAARALLPEQMKLELEF
jgi:hypothetical protein